MSPNKNILVTGANGQLGRSLQDKKNSLPGFSFHFYSKDELAIDNQHSIIELFAGKHFDYCINTAAYTAVDKAESEPAAAFATNAASVAWLATVCCENKCRLIHISTDYVFDGNKPGAYTEEDATSPIGVYGASKLQGEQLALSNDVTAMVIRTSWVFSEYGNNFVKTMIRLMDEREEINVVNDQLGSPTYAADLADCILAVIASGKPLHGIYHYCNRGTVTWFDFANEIRKIKNSGCRINPISTSAYPTAAKRPANSVLSTEKIVTALGVTIPTWQSGLEICMKHLEKKN